MWIFCLTYASFLSFPLVCKWDCWYCSFTTSQSERCRRCYRGCSDNNIKKGYQFSFNSPGSWWTLAWGLWRSHVSFAWLGNCWSWRWHLFTSLHLEGILILLYVFMRVKCIWTVTTLYLIKSWLPLLICNSI